MAMKFSVSFGQKDKELYKWIIEEYVSPSTQAKQFFKEAREKKIKESAINQPQMQQPQRSGLTDLDF